MRRRLFAAAAVTALLGGVVSPAPGAHALLVPDAASAQAVKQCGVLFSMPGNDPSGLWKRMNDPNGPVVIIKFEPVPEDGKGTRTGVPNEGDDIRIVWDHTHDIKLDGITSGPCEALYHEFQHAADDDDEVPDLDETCNEISKAEWRAVKAQNALRRALGLPDQRTKYHGKPLGGYGSFEDCKKDKEPAAPPKQKSNSAFGDPHITTTDGLIYDLQQVGEFTAFTSDDADAPRVQLRTAAVPDSAFASMINGAAAGAGDRRVAFVLDDGQLTITHGPSEDTVTVGQGAEQDLGDGLTIATAAPNANFVGSSYTVRWPDGSELAVDASGFWGLRVSFEPSDQAKGANPRGLLGTFNGDPSDDLTRPDGDTVPVDSPDAVIRSDFGAPWRITQDDSLFPYGPGQSTDTFTDREFPSDEPRFPADVTDQARQVCRSAGVIGEAILAACVFDVAVTGNPSLADTAAQVSDDSTVTVVAGEPVNAKGFGPGRAVSGAVRNDQPVDFEFTARAGEVANIRSSCTATGSEVAYTVAAVTGSIAEPLGIVNGCTDLGRVAFATDGTYRLAITGDGRYGIRWQTTPGDQRRALNPSASNAGRVVAGTRHHLRFTVTPGQQWTFTPDAGCTPVGGFDWSVVDDSGALNDRGINEGCNVIGPLDLAPGRYDVQIDAQGADADYSFTASSEG